ncbi:hypothetical protein E2C01_097224 [Portunus trituberculatus]|uniref:Uncharacterized protein n=1 Tax=Portunus trituberculatus TaxID=210409 RepID=A0A5B7KAN9_PORTR|nr:hypothetical protein [Portunus trituberculatus]
MSHSPCSAEDERWLGGRRGVVWCGKEGSPGRRGLHKRNHTGRSGEGGGGGGVGGGIGAGGEFPAALGEKGSGADEVF